jgi:hypothetical protein
MCVGFSTVRVTELWMPPRWPVISEPGVRHDLLLRVIHEAHAFFHALRHHRARRQRTVGVEDLDPVVIDDAGLSLRIGLRHPDDRPAARQRQHQQVVGIGGVDAPLLVRRDEVQRDDLVRRSACLR